CWGFFLMVEAQANTDCSAVFEYDTPGDIYTESGAITFHNFSTGDYTNLEWDFGDGTSSTQIADSINHFYTANGTYTVTLTIWTTDQSCYSKEEQQIYVFDSSNEDCELTDCVFPGNTNGDDQADLSDLLNIAKGFNTIGQPRPNASLDWYGQPAPDWAKETPDGINYKHLDCNGDGMINFSDITAVTANYSPMNLPVSNIQADAPRVYLQFDHDTIYIDDTTPETITLSAALLLGDNEKPMEDIVGLAAHLGYDTTFVQVEQGVSTKYNQNNFMAQSGNFLPYATNLRDNSQIDIAFSRLDGQGSNGYGRIAIIEFVIIVDIIGGRAETETIFDIPVNGIIAVGSDGQPMDIALDAEPAKVVFLSDLTALNNPELEKQIKIFPNPATTHLNIQIGDLRGSQIELFDLLGQQVLVEPMNGNQHQLATGHLAKGLYLLNIQTDEGVATRKVMIE
ncbi:MAG: T9SS type A sorting domain-containing protein, partial [Bacteroidota bacterium]